MDRELLKQLSKDSLQIELTEEQLDCFSLYEELLLSWNEKFNLTAITDKTEILLKHFLDSLFGCVVVDFKYKSICDIGSGAGFPGIPLAIVNPTAQVTLVEANGKKISFLNEVVNKLKLHNVVVINSRAEDLTKFRNHFDYLTARAVTKTNVLVEIGVPLLKVNGKLVLYKLFDDEQELVDASFALKQLGSSLIKNQKYELPILKDQRSLVIIEKNEETKNKYPRPFNQISKNPL